MQQPVNSVKINQGLFKLPICVQRHTKSFFGRTIVRVYLNSLDSVFDGFIISSQYEVASGDKIEYVNAFLIFKYLLASDYQSRFIIIVHFHSFCEVKQRSPTVASLLQFHLALELDEYHFQTL